MHKEQQVEYEVLQVDEVVEVDEDEVEVEVQY